MPKKCAAANCTNYQAPGSGKSFHRFPKDELLLKQWLVQLNRLDPITNEPWMPNGSSVICSDHFEDDCFTARSRLRTKVGFEFDQDFKPTLEKAAIPTVFEHKRRATTDERAICVTPVGQHRHTYKAILIFDWPSPQTTRIRKKTAFNGRQLFLSTK